jgi:Glycosyltransferase WbsX/Repeat of unknown function (DUF5648)
VIRETWLRHLPQAILLFSLVVDITGVLAAELPPGLSRFNPAGLSNDWQYEGIAFRALRLPNSGLATIPIQRLHHPTSGYLLASSESEVSAAKTKGFILEGTAFYALATSGMPVLRFRNPMNDSLFYTTSLGDGNKLKFSYEGVAFYAYDPPPAAISTEEPTSGAADIVSVFRYRNQVNGIYLFTAGPESSYQVGAYYFGSFTPNATEIIRSTEKVYGRSGDWWGGVRDFYGAEPGIGKDHRGWSGEWPNLKPEIGYYNQASVKTLEQHIAQAADAGLSFFSFYWYWSNAKHGELLPEALSSFLRARNVTRLKFNLSLYAHPWSDDMVINPGNTEEIVQRLVGYFGNPQYLRLPDGRPVFSIGDDRNMRDANGNKCTEDRCYEKSLGAFLEVLRKRSVEKLGVAPFIEVQVGVPAWDKQTGEDALTCLAPPFRLVGGTPYPEFTKEDFKPFVSSDKPFSPCMLENFDERPRQDILISDRAAIRYLIGKTDSKFRHNLTIAMEISDQNYQYLKSPASRIIYLYAWNEWHEGGILEPNIYSDARDLNIVTDVFQLSRLPSPCLDKGDCNLEQH